MRFLSMTSCRVSFLILSCSFCIIKLTLISGQQRRVTIQQQGDKFKTVTFATRTTINKNYPIVDIPENLMQLDMSNRYENDITLHEPLIPFLQARDSNIIKCTKILNFVT